MQNKNNARDITPYAVGYVAASVIEVISASTAGLDVINKVNPARTYTLSVSIIEGYASLR